MYLILLPVTPTFYCRFPLFSCHSFGCALDPEFLHAGSGEHNLAPFRAQRYVGILQTGARVYPFAFPLDSSYSVRGASTCALLGNSKHNRGTLFIVSRFFCSGLDGDGKVGQELETGHLYC